VEAALVATAAPQARKLLPQADCVSAELRKLPDLDTSLIDAALPPILFPEGIKHFRDRTSALLRGESKGHVRIAVYGDSNMTMDFVSGGMRRLLQGRYGDAGHGYVALARPWNWYRHMDVRHGIYDKHWKAIATSTAPVLDGHYGHANIAGESGTPGAFAWVQTASEDAPIGGKVTDVDLYYLAQPFGGTFQLSVDGEKRQMVDTLSEKVETRVLSLTLADAEHKISATVERGLIRLFGVSMERNEKPSFVVDSLGVGALNYEQFTRVSDASRRPMLEHRGYDLVLFMLGTNMYAPHLTEAWVEATLKSYREALPDASMLIVGAPDMETKRPLMNETDARIIKLNEQLKGIAEKHRASFWDAREAMGGNGSMHKLARAGAAEWDMIHFKKDGGMLLGQRLTHALWDQIPVCK
jgi:hypothetical protein